MRDVFIFLYWLLYEYILQDGDHEITSDDERLREEKEKEKLARTEASLREREKEVQRTLATHLRDRDKEREQHKRDEAIQVIQ